MRDISTTGSHGMQKTTGRRISSTRLSKAISSIKSNNTIRTIIQLGPGVYREKIVIKKRLPFITLLGDSENPPTIMGNDTAATSGADAPSPAVGSVGGQAVALRISGNKAAFYNCSFYGHQDTLYDHKVSHYFKDCDIEGSVDFVFGYGRSLYESCHLKSISLRVIRHSSEANKRVHVEGFLIHELFGVWERFGESGESKGRARGDHSRVVSCNTHMDDIVIPEGWNDWGISQRESSVNYGGYKCSGPEANTTGRVHWARRLTDEEARPLLVTYYLDGDKWLLDV